MAVAVVVLTVSLGTLLLIGPVADLRSAGDVTVEATDLAVTLNDETLSASDTATVRLRVRDGSETPARTTTEVVVEADSRAFDC